MKFETGNGNALPPEEKIEETEEEKFNSLTKEDVEAYEVPGAEKILEIMSEEVSKEDKEKLKEVVDTMPLNKKAEIVKIFKNQLKLFKDLGMGLGEKINWDSKKKKAVVCLGIYALMNVMGSVLHASESDTESDTDLGDDLDASFVKSTLSNAFNELELKNVTEDAGALFFSASIELAKEMNERGVEKMRYAYVVDKMLKWSECVQENKGSLEELQYGLTEISGDYLEHLDNLEKLEDQTDSSDSDTSIESGHESISNEIVLPEKIELEFDSHFSEVEKMNIQEYYNVTIEEIHAAAEKFEWWGEKYGHKENFTDFEKGAKDYISELIDMTKQIENNANDSDFNGSFYVNKVGNNAVELAAEVKLEEVASRTSLRTAEEKMNDAFDF